jgi:hypothetical protein
MTSRPTDFWVPHVGIKMTALSLALACLVFLVYAGAMENGVVWDTPHYLSNNDHVHEFNIENIRWALTTQHFHNWHPVTWFSYMLDYSIYGGLDPWGFHLTNVVLHGVNAVLLFFVSFALLSKHHGNEKKYESTDMLAAFFAALLLAVHPQHVESVVWIAERKDVLFLLFTILCVWFYIKFSETEKAFNYWLALLCAAMAMASKPMAISIPVILLLLDVYPLRRVAYGVAGRGAFSRGTYGYLLVEKTPFILASLFLAYMTMSAQQGPISEAPTLDIFQKVAVILLSYWSYLSKFLFPVSFSPFYPISEELSVVDYLPAVLGLMAITILAIYGMKKGQSWWLVCWLFYLLTLLPVVGVVKVGAQVSADRYAYMPLIPIYILTGVLFARLVSGGKRVGRAISVLVLAGVFFFLSSSTREYIKVWESNYTLWTHAANHSPNSLVVLANIGNYCYNFQKYEEARYYLSKMLPLLNDDPEGKALVLSRIHELNKRLDVSN